MRILLINDEFPPTPYWGGATTYCWRLANSLARLGHDISVISLDNTNLSAIDFRSALKIKAERIGEIISYRLDWRPAYLFKMLSKNLFNPIFSTFIKKVVKMDSPDVVHVMNTILLSLSTYKAKNSSTSPWIQTAHDYWLICPRINLLNSNEQICRLYPSNWCKNCIGSIHSSIRRKLIPKIIKKLDRIITPSEFVKSVFMSTGIPEEKISVLFTPIDMNIFDKKITTEDITLIKQRFNIGLDKKIVLFAGRLVREKGIEYVIQAFPQVLQKFPESILIIVGPYLKKYQFYLKKIIERKNLSKSVVFLGSIPDYSDMPLIYAIADVVVVPSVWLEPMGLIVCESMACGKPVIGSTFGGMPELIENKETGMIVNPYNTKKLADSINFLLLNDEIRDKMGKKGKIHAKETFTISKHIQKLLKIYNSA